ncbi:hypothetical protein BGAL_0028g00440 [Botrytis galanthina]|uniref:Zn(2)-C6 fungal-type domain-containing protein n=1 Tax=Botrytis galanthina TaxID=278940 RepID=A0A4S8R8S3_9HELO|nr:hypothetical protein BGAL_0028g00440 [Botrytis galanthina]
MTSNTTKVPQMQSRSSKQSRDRTILSCTECHRRKQKCNRNHPCNNCLERRVPHKCHFVIPLRRWDPKLDYQTTKAARDRRILAGEEVLLSLESVDDLRSVGSSYASTRAPTDLTQTLFSNHTSTHDIKSQASFWPNLTSGILDGFDPFSILPDTSGDPLPKSILIEYCPWLGTYDDSKVVGGGDGEEYEMHLLGINQMLIMRGGMGSLGMRGMIKNWLGVCYGPWNHDWHYGLFVDFYGIKRQSNV